MNLKHGLWIFWIKYMRASKACQLWLGDTNLLCSVVFRGIHVDYEVEIIREPCSRHIPIPIGNSIRLNAENME